MKNSRFGLAAVLMATCAGIFLFCLTARQGIHAWEGSSSAGAATRLVSGQAMAGTLRERPAKPAFLPSLESEPVPPLPEAGDLPVTIDMPLSAANPPYPLAEERRREIAEVCALKLALEVYAERQGDFPQGESPTIGRQLVSAGLLAWPQEQTGPEGELLDASAMPYYLETAPGRRFAIIAAGPDKAFDTADDRVHTNFEVPGPP